VPTFRKLFLSDSAAVGAGLRGQAGVCFNQPGTGAFCLVSKHTDEARPTRIIHRLGKDPACQPFDVQLLHDNQRVGLYQLGRQLGRQLVQKVGALPSYLAMGGGYSLAILLSEWAVAGYLCELPLCLSKPLLSIAKEAGIIHLFTVGQVSEVFEANVKTDSFTHMCRRLKLVLNRETGIPMDTVSLDSDNLDLPTDRTVQLELERANLGQCEPIVVQGPTQLGIGETVVSIPTLKAKAWVSTPTKESLERLVYPVKNVLQRLAIHVCKVWSGLLAFYKSGGLVGKADTLARHAVGISSVLERGVVQLSAQVKAVLQQVGLPAGRKESVLVRFPSKHLDAFLSVNVLLDNLSGNIARCARKIRTGPQTRQLEQVRVLFSQVVRRSTFYFGNHISGAISRSYPGKQVDMVRHDGKFQYLPVMRSTDFVNDRLAVLRHILHKHLLAPLWAKYQVVHNEVYPVFVTLILHASILLYSTLLYSTLYLSVCQVYQQHRHGARGRTHSSTAAKAAWLSAKD
jgi:hypothetical protein